MLLSVSAIGSKTLLYSWYKRNNATQEGILLTNNASLIPNNYYLPVTTTNDQGEYYVTITNPSESIITSNNVIVTINPILSIFSQSVSQSVVVGDPLTLNVVAQGGTEPYTYQWVFNGAPLANQNNNVFTIANVNDSNQGKYVLTIKDFSNTAINSQEINVTTTIPIIIANQPFSQKLIVGEILDLSVATTGVNPISYQWYKETTAINGATQATYSITSVSLTDESNYSVHIQVTDNTYIYSSSAYIQVNTIPVITTQPINTSLTIGSSLLLSVSASGSKTLLYSWYKINNATQEGVLLTNNFSLIPDNYYLPVTTKDDEGEYYVTITNPSGYIITSNIIQVIINNVITLT